MNGIDALGVPRAIQGETPMTHSFNPGCACCAPRGLSRRQFLCSTAAGVAAAPIVAASVIGDAEAARRASTAKAAGRPILLKGGCVLSLRSEERRAGKEGR